MLQQKKSTLKAAAAVTPAPANTTRNPGTTQEGGRIRQNTAVTPGIARVYNGGHIGPGHNTRRAGGLWTPYRTRLDSEGENRRRWGQCAPSVIYSYVWPDFHKPGLLGHALSSQPHTLELWR